MRIILVGAVLLVSSFAGTAQQPEAGSVERRVSLTETAVAMDASGTPALEATLRTTTLNGATDSPVTNISLVLKNSSSLSYAFVSGLVTFYDGAGVRCGEGLFKADALAVGEAIETDTPGIRIRCAPATWRIVANNLVPRLVPNPVSANGVPPSGVPGVNLVISVDGEEHPIQLERPLVLTLGDSRRTIIVRAAP
jgi:hypothetical protein